MQSSPDTGCGLESYLSAERSSPARHYCAPRNSGLREPCNKQIGSTLLQKHCRLRIHCCRQPSRSAYGPCSARRCQSSTASRIPGTAPFQDSREAPPMLDRRSPRVVPIWFHRNGRELVTASPPKAPKLKALANNPKVAITIDDNTFPHKIRRSGELCGDCSRARGAAFPRHSMPHGEGLAHPHVESDRHGAYHDHAAVGRTARFRDPLPSALSG